MIMQDEIYFEILNDEDYIRIEPISLVNQDSPIVWDNNWIQSKVIVKKGAFSGKFDADFQTVDFEKFKQELKVLYNNLKGYANFNCLEDYLELSIKGDGLGHFEVIVKANDKPGYGSKLSFELYFDQTQIKELVNQLNRITQKFPIE